METIKENMYKAAESLQEKAIPILAEAKVMATQATQNLKDTWTNKEGNTEIIKKIDELNSKIDNLEKKVEGNKK